MNTQELYSKICKWLGLERAYPYTTKSYYAWIKGIATKIDFLNNRDQQRLIENKLIELLYQPSYEYFIPSNKWHVTIWGYDEINGEEEIATCENESKDFAFLSAVEQLIDKDVRN